VTEKKTTLVFKLSLIAGMLIFINGLWIAANRAPITFSSFRVDAVENLRGPDAPSWGRITFGLGGLVEGSLMPIWLVFAVINLFSALMLYTKPKKHVRWSFLILVCSILSIPIGGGFAVGLILGVLGGVMGVEGPSSPGKTFIGKLGRAARLDSKLFDMVAEESKALKQAAIVIILVNILRGLGNALYTYNAEIIINSLSPEVPFRILLLGEVSWDLWAVAGPTINLIGIALIKWLILSGLIYLVGVKIAGTTAELDSIARVVAFAYVPICLQILMPLIFGSEPFLKFQWPLTIFFLTNIWMIIALVIGVKQSLDMPTGRAFGVVLLAGTFYWLINYMFIIPTLKIPTIQFTVEPVSLILTLVSVSGILATLLGVFSRR